MKRILIVDDDDAIGRMLTLILQSDGHRAVAVTSTLAACEYLRANAIDLVLSELSIGRRMDGLALSTYVRRKWPNARFVLGTRSDDLDPCDSRVADVDAVITKPYRLADLRHIVSLPAGSAVRGGRAGFAWATRHLTPLHPGRSGLRKAERG